MVTPKSSTLEQITRRYRLRDPNTPNSAIANCLSTRARSQSDSLFYIPSDSMPLLAAIRTKQDEMVIFKCCDWLHDDVLKIADEITADEPKDTHA